MNTRTLSDHRGRPVPQFLLGAAITAAITTLTSYLGGADRQAVGAVLLLSLALVLAIVAWFAFYGDPRWPWLRPAALLGVAVLVGLMVAVAWLTVYEPPPETRTYAGTTSQGRRVEFDVVDGKAIGRIEFDVEGTCPTNTSDGVSQTEPCTCEVNKETTMPRPWPIADDTYFSYAPGDFDFGAIFVPSRTTATGSLRVHTSDIPGAEGSCDSGRVTWTASAP